MAGPIIDSFSANPSTVPPHGSFVVTMVAHDPDEQTGLLVGTVRDSQGNEAQASAIVHISDPLTFSLAAPAGYTVSPRVGQPGVFDVVAP